jgi:hypothetical protein
VAQLRASLNNDRLAQLLQVFATNSTHDSLSEIHAEIGWTPTRKKEILTTDDTDDADKDSERIEMRFGR